MERSWLISNTKLVETHWKAEAFKKAEEEAADLAWKKARDATALPERVWRMEENENAEDNKELEEEEIEEGEGSVTYEEEDESW